MPENKQFIVNIGDQGEIWDSDMFAEKGDALFAKYKDAEVFEVEDTDSFDEDPTNHQYIINLGDQSELWDADMVRAKGAKLMEAYPDVKIQRVSYKDYWGERATANRERRKALEQPDAERNARLAEIGYYDDLSYGQGEFNMDTDLGYGLKPLSSAIETNSVSGEATYLDPRVQEFFVNDTAETERQAEIARLDAEYESNPSVIAQREWEAQQRAEQAKYIDTQLAAINAEVEEIDAHRASVGAMANSMDDFAMASLAFDPKGSVDAALEDEKLQTYRSAAKLYEKARQANEVAGKGFWAAAGDVGKDKLRDLVTQSDIEMYNQIGDILTRLEDKLGNLNDVGEDVLEANLSKEEQALIKAFFEYNSAMSDAQQDMSKAYKGGKIFGESVGFMLEFLATGGLAGGAGKAASSGVGRALVKWASKAAKGTAKRAFRTGTTKALRGLSSAAVGTLARTVAAPGTYRNMAEQSVKIEDGHLDRTKNATKAFFDSYIENLSEISGGVIGKSLGMFGLNPSKLLGKVSFGKIGQLLADNRLAQGLSKGVKALFGEQGALTKLGFNGIFEEVEEEYIGNFIREVTGVQPGALAEMHKDGNFGAMLIGFAPMTLFGAGMSAANMAATNIEAANLGKKLRETLGQHYTEDAVSHMMSLVDNAENADEVWKAIEPMAGALNEEETTMLYQYGAFKAQNKVMLFARKAQERQLADAKRAEIQQDYGKFWQEGEDGAQSVQMADLNDGRRVFVLSAANEQGEIAVVDTRTGETGIANVADIKSAEQDGVTSPQTRTWSMDAFLDYTIALDRRSAEQTRMVNERDQQIEALKSGITEGMEINLGTEGSPVIMLATGQFTKDGVLAGDASGNIHTIGWEQVADALGTPIRVKTDQDLIDEETAAIAARRAERRKKAGSASQQLRAALYETAQQTAEVVSLEERHIPKNPDGSVNETAFWEQDPEGYAQWNDEQNKDGGADTMRQLAVSKMLLAGVLAEAQKATQTSNPAERKAAEQAVREIQDKIDRYTAIEQSYVERAIAPLRERAMKWNSLTGASVILVENEEQLAEISGEAARQSAGGARVRGFAKDGRAYIYLPGVQDAAEIDAVFVHEAVSHQGLKGLLGQKGFDELCEQVWQMMSPEMQNVFINYPGVNGNRLAAADEYIAHIAERMGTGVADETERTIWEKIVDFVRNILRAMGIEVGMNERELSDLLHMAYADLARNMSEAEKIAQQNAERKEAVGAAPATARQMYDAYIKEGLTPEEVSQGVRNDFNAAKEAYDAKVAEKPTIKVGESTASFIERKKAYNEELGRLEQELRMQQALMDEIAKIQTPAMETAVEEAPVAEEVLEDNGIGVDAIGLDESAAEGEDVRFSTIREVNDRFNAELQQQIDGTLPVGHVYQLGMPSRILRSTGIADAPIQLNSTRLEDKAKNFGHDFDLSEIKDLVNALQSPMGIFAYGDKSKAQNIVVEIQHKGKNFIVGLAIKPTVNGRVLDVNSIRNVFPKDNAEWLNWISQNKALYLDKEKIQGLIDQQRTNLADVEYLDLDSIAKIVENFENPSSEDARFSVITPEMDADYLAAVERGDIETAQRMVLEAAKLAMPNTKVVDEDGNPKIVYHGDKWNNGFTAFDPNAMKAHGETREGFSWFTYSEEHADIYAKMFEEDADEDEVVGHVYNVVLNALNPYYVGSTDGEIKSEGKITEEGKNFIEKVKDVFGVDISNLIPSSYKYVNLYELVRTEEFANIITSHGYDSVSAIEGGYNTIGVVNPSQIKSADPVTYDDNGNVIPLSERFNPENEDIRFSARTDEQREKLFADAKAKFGLTNNFKVAGYMLPDGSLLDFSEANDGGDPNQRTLDHREIEGVIMENGTEYDSRWMYLADFMNEGAIRLLPEYAGINLMKAPTKEQRQRLMDFIYKYNGEVILEIADERLNNVAYVEYGRRTSPSRIFRDIDGYFNEGIVPEQDTRFSIANENQAIFVSNAARAVEAIKMEKATPAQWLAMIEKNGGLKAGEDKWMGLSDWLKASKAKTLTKAEVLDFINENMIVIEEQHYAVNAEADAENTHAMIERILQEKFGGYIAEYYEQNNGEDDNLYGGDSYEYAMDKLREEMNDEFPYTIERSNSVVYLTFPYEETDELQEWADKLGVKFAPQNPINSTRLAYTTDGLSNRHEIALIIPTIEPWNESDEVHFGDAGEGRAVAWIRFGEASTEGYSVLSMEANAATKALEDFEDEMSAKYNLEIDEALDEMTWEELIRHQELSEAEDVAHSKYIHISKGRKVLVIDEIQSKRHQEGREKGYRTSREDLAKATEAFQSFNRAMKEKYGENVFPSEWSEEDQAEFDRLRDEHARVSKSYDRGVPDAPFDKNWHELAMKRMLRYAAENGYDVIAWTKGEQQAERYDIGGVVSEISVKHAGPSGYEVESFNGSGYSVLYGVYPDVSTIAEVYGKELAERITDSVSSYGDKATINGNNLKVGGEGMKGFYDKMLPAFMNKYGKKWGVKVEDIELPGLENGLTMHSVPVTEEMKASVMEGQVMFSIVNDKTGSTSIPDFEFEDDIRFSLSKNNRKTISGWLNKRADLTEDAKNAVLDYIDQFEDATLQLAMGKWFTQNVIRLPEDAEKCMQAVASAKKAKMDPMKFSSPMEIIERHGVIKSKEKPIDPDTVSTLRRAKELPDGIVIYDVEESEESRQNMRRIINTHYGKNSSPWCLLQGDENGNLTAKSAGYWNQYNAYPKQVAFKDGRLLAFGANDRQERIWWDRLDKPHDGIPVPEKIEGDRLGRSIPYVINTETGEKEREGNIFRRTEQDGVSTLTEWASEEEGDVIEFHRTKDGEEIDGFTLIPSPLGFFRKRINYVRQGDMRLFFVNRNLRSVNLGNSRVTIEGAYVTYGVRNEEGELVEVMMTKDGKPYRYWNIDMNVPVQDKKRLAQYESRFNEIESEFAEVVANAKTIAEQKVKELVPEVRFSVAGISPDVRAEMDVIAATAMVNGNYMLAPNGQPTKLTADQWAMVRTRNFINWFGDWINDPENASKVVDENGEPMVVYHGTLAKNLTRFDKDFIGSRYSYDEKGFFFISRESIANDYATPDFGTGRGAIIPAFINLKNPLFVDQKWAAKNGLGNRVFKDNDVIEFWDNYQTLMVEESQNNDGVIISDGTDLMVVAFEPSQIKSATDNTGEFSESEDIRFSAHRPVGGNRGYVGYSMSKRAAAAREEGRYPKTDFRKEYGVTEKALDALVKAGIINNSEWHHTSVYGNRTTFYGWNEDYYADIYAELKSQIDKLAREGKTEEIEKMFSEHPISVLEERKRDRVRKIAHAGYVRDKSVRDANSKYKAAAQKEQMSKIKDALAADERVSGNWFNASNGVGIRMDTGNINYPEGISRAEKNTMREEARKELADLRAEVMANTPLEYDEAAYNAAIESAEQVYRQDMQRIAEEYADLAEEDTRFSAVIDPMLVAKLESEPKVKVYRAMQLIDGKLYPPMSAYVDGVLREPSELGQWEQAEENTIGRNKKDPSKVDLEQGKGDDGKKRKTSGVLYNPYFHTSLTPLNDQFSGAQTRSNLVIVETEVPQSELTSGYQAEGAANSVGMVDWHSGPIAGVLAQYEGKGRQVILSRWAKPIRIVPESEIADIAMKLFEGTTLMDVPLPSNVFTPALREELERRGMQFVETTNNGRLVSDRRRTWSKTYGKNGLAKRPTEDIRFSIAERPVDEIVNDGKMMVARGAEAAKTALLDRMKNIDKSLEMAARMIASAQREYDRATVKIITDAAQSLLKEGALSKATNYEVSRLLSAVKNATGRKDLTKAVNTLIDIMVANQLRHSREMFRQMLKIKATRVNTSGVEAQGRLDLVGQKVVAMVKEAIEMDLSQLEERIGETEDRISSGSETVRSNAEIDLVGLKIAKQYLEGVKASESEEILLRDELKRAGEDHAAGSMTDEAYREFVKSTEDAVRQNRIERTKEYRNILHMMAETIAESFTGAKNFRDAEKARIERIHHFANSDLQGMSAEAHEQKVNEFWNAPLVRLVTAPLATFEQWMRVFGQKSAEGKGYLYNHFVGGWNDATNAEYLGIKAAHEILDAKVQEVFSGVAKRWSDLFSIDKKMPTATISMWDDGQMRDYEVTQGNLLYVYMVNKMTDGKMKLRKMGITEADVDAIVRQMDPRFLELADWIQDEFLPSLRDKYNAVHERLFGAPMAAIDSYFPIRVLANARVRDIELGADTEGSRPSSITGSIIKRTKNSLALDVLGSNAFDVVLEHIEQMEHWAAFAEFNRDLNTLLSYRTFRNRVQNMSTAFGSGREAWNSFKETAEIVAGVYKPKTSKVDKALTNAVKGLTAGKISLRLWTAMKQVLSIPAFLPYVNPAHFVKNFATPWIAWNWAMDELPAFEKRWRSREAGNVRLKKTDADWKLWSSKIMEIATRIGMTPNAAVDAFTCAIGAKSVYDTMYARYTKDGYSHEMADKKAKLDATVAFNATQQSSESAFVSAIQSDRTFVAHMATVFRNNSFGMGREFVDALRNMRDRTLPGYKEMSIEFMRKQMVREGVSEEDAVKAAERIYRNTLFKDAARIATFGFMMQFLWNLGNNALYLMFGDDDDEKKEMVKDALIKGAFGSAEGLAFGNVVPELASAVASDKLKNFSISTAPAVSDVKSLWKELNTDFVAGASDLVNIIGQMAIGMNPQTIVDVALAIYDACEGNLDTSKEVAIALLRIVNAPQSNIDKLIMDEVDFTIDEGLDMTIDEFARRYARYKKSRNAPYTEWAYSDEAARKAEEKYIKRFRKDAEALKRTRGNENAQEFYEYYDNGYKETSETLRDLRKRLQEEDSQENRDAMEQFQLGYPFFELNVLSSDILAFEAARQAMKDADTPEDRSLYESMMYEARDRMVKTQRMLEFLEPYQRRVFYMQEVQNDLRGRMKEDPENEELQKTFDANEERLQRAKEDLVMKRAEWQSREDAGSSE